MAVRIPLAEYRPKWLEAIPGPTRAAMVLRCPACCDEEWTVWLLREGTTPLGITTVPERVVREASGWTFENLTLSGHLWCKREGAYIFVVNGDVVVG
jgi:hypothetical protein